MSFTIVAGPRQRSHSQVHFTASDSRLPQRGGPGPRIYEYIPQERASPVIPPGTVFPFHRLLRLAGLRWRYSNHAGLMEAGSNRPRYIASGRTA
jgi:hypothetical protein